MRRQVFTRICVAATLAISVVCAAGAQGAPLAQVSGAVTVVTPDQFTIQTPGKPVGVINALTVAANRVTALDLPYVWGGGHGQAGVASIGVRGGPGYNGKRTGYDCSGAVAAVLVAAGLWPQGSGVPNDWGIIRYLLANKEIAPGAGTGPAEVTLYDHPGVHIFMNIDGRFWGTSDGGAGADPEGGPGWLDDGASDATDKQFRRYHFVSSALNTTTTAGDSFTFDVASGEPVWVSVGSEVSVAYSTSQYGTLVASAVTDKDLSTAAGAVTAIGAGNASFTIQAATGISMTFEVTPGSTVAEQIAADKIAVNAVVVVSYQTSQATTASAAGQTLTAATVTVNAAPPPAPGSVGL